MGVMQCLLYWLEENCQAEEYMAFTIWQCISKLQKVQNQKKTLSVVTNCFFYSFICVHSITFLSY